VDQLNNGERKTRLEEAIQNLTKHEGKM